MDDNSRSSCVHNLHLFVVPTSIVYCTAVLSAVMASRAWFNVLEYTLFWEKGGNILDTRDNTFSIVQIVALKFSCD